MIDTVGGRDDNVELLQDVIIILASELAGTWPTLLTNTLSSKVGQAFLRMLGLPVR